MLDQAQWLDGVLWQIEIVVLDQAQWLDGVLWQGAEQRG